MCSSDLYDRIKFSGFQTERPLQLRQSGNQGVLDQFQNRNVYRRRNDIIAGLAHVHVVVGMDRLFLAYLSTQRQIRAISDHLVGIHVGGSTRAGLKNIENKMLIEFSSGGFSSGGHNRIPDALIEKPKIHIGTSGGEFNQSDGPNKFSGKAKIADRKI